MVEVSVSQKHGIDAIGRDEKGLPISSPELPFLIKAAVYQESDVVGFDKIL
jgi:hypothetical protein